MREEYALKQSAYMKSRFAKERQWNYGKHWSEEDKEKQRIAHKGQKAWNKGIPMSEEAKKKLSINNGSRRLDVKQKISAAHKGKKLSDAHKQKDRDAMIGMLWWNNGVKCVRARECPPGFVAGRLKKKKQ